MIRRAVHPTFPFYFQSELGFLFLMLRSMCLHVLFVFSAQQKREVWASSPVLPAAQSDAGARLLSTLQLLLLFDVLVLRIFDSQLFLFELSAFVNLDLAYLIVCRYKYIQVIELEYKLIEF